MSAPGRLGVGETQETVFRVPEGAIGYWAHRFVEQGRHAPGADEALRRDRAGVQGPRRHAAGAGRPCPASRASRPGASGEVPAEHAIRGFHGVSLLLDDAAPTGAILTDVLGFAEVAREGSLVRYQGGRRRRWAASSTSASPAAFLPGRMGGGSVHHIAFRAADDAAQAADGREAGARSPHPDDGAEGPQLLPVGLLPRARRHAVRDRDRRAGLRRRRAGGLARARR